MIQPENGSSQPNPEPLGASCAGWKTPHFISLKVTETGNRSKPKLEDAPYPTNRPRNKLFIQTGMQCNTMLSSHHYTELCGSEGTYSNSLRRSLCQQETCWRGLASLGVHSATPDVQWANTICTIFACHFWLDSSNAFPVQGSGLTGVFPPQLSSRRLWVLAHEVWSKRGKVLYLGYQVALSCKHFHLEISVRAVNNIGFIHHTGDAWILVNYNLAWKEDRRYSG